MIYTLYLGMLSQVYILVAYNKRSQFMLDDRIVLIQNDYSIPLLEIITTSIYSEVHLYTFN